MLLLRISFIITILKTLIQRDDIYTHNDVYSLRTETDQYLASVNTFFFRFPSPRLKRKLTTRTYYFKIDWIHMSRLEITYETLRATASDMTFK